MSEIGVLFSLYFKCTDYGDVVGIKFDIYYTKYTLTRSPFSMDLYFTETQNAK